jgi:hypothetical protein
MQRWQQYSPCSGLPCSLPPRSEPFGHPILRSLSELLLAAYVLLVVLVSPTE